MLLLGILIDALISGWLAKRRSFVAQTQRSERQMSLYRRGICLRWTKLRDHPDLCDKAGEQGEHGKDAAGSPVVRWVEQLRWPL